MVNPSLAFENLTEYVHNNAFGSFHCTDLDYSFAGWDFFFNWDSLHARQNSRYEAWNYKKKKCKKIKA